MHDFEAPSKAHTLALAIDSEFFFCHHNLYLFDQTYSVPGY